MSAISSRVSATRCPTPSTESPTWNWYLAWAAEPTPTRNTLPTPPRVPSIRNKNPRYVWLRSSNERVRRIRGWTPVTAPAHSTLSSIAASSSSGSGGRLIEASTMSVPSVESEVDRRTLHRHRWPPRLCRVCSVVVVIVLKISKLSLQICCRPEQCPVQELAPNRADQALYKRMRERNIWNRLDFGYVEKPKIGLPLVKPNSGS